MKASTRRSPRSTTAQETAAWGRNKWKKQDLIKDYCQEPYSNTQKRMEGEQAGTLTAVKVSLLQLILSLAKIKD